MSLSNGGDVVWLKGDVLRHHSVPGVYHVLDVMHNEEQK